MTGASASGRQRVARQMVVIALATAAAACGSRSRPPQMPAPAPAASAPSRVFEGLASYYGEAFHGKPTASGIPFDMHAMVAAHPTFPFNTVVRVTNMANRRRVTVRIVDRGPAPSVRADGVVIDLSQGAAAALRFLRQGRTRVRIDVLKWGN